MTLELPALIGILSWVTLVEMMLAAGLGVSFGQIGQVLKERGLVARALFGSYVVLPAAAVGLLIWFQSNAHAAAGFLVIAVCPGAPFLPAFTLLAKGDAAKAVGLMAILAATSAFAAPLLLQWLMPFVFARVPTASIDLASMSVNALTLAGSLFLAQLLPLGIGLVIRQVAPAMAARAKKPADRLSALLNIALLSLIIYAQFDAIVAVPPRAFLGMSLLLAAGVAAGCVLGRRNERRELAIAVAVRNVGVAIAVVGSQFAGTPAVAATTIFALFQTIVMAAASAVWGRFTAAAPVATALPRTAAAVHPTTSALD